MKSSPTSAAVRFVCAPAGSGKTAALLHYAARSGALYISVRREAERACENAGAFMAAIPDNVTELIVDDLDAASPRFVDALLDAIASGSVPHCILGGRSRLRMRASRLLAGGAATMLDAATFAFTRIETARLAEQHGLIYDEEDLMQLLHDTDGWPIAVHWVMRDAARSGGRLRGAFEAWHQSRGYLLTEFLAAEHENDADALIEFTVMLRRGFEGADGALERFEALGFPILRSRASLRPYRVMARIANTDNELADVAHSPAHPQMRLKLLGRFSCEIGGRPIEFVRRRDQNALTFVALARGGRATRRALIEAFWPGLDREAATQGLRTTLSRIRKAIAAVVGPSMVDEYFRSADEICIDERVALDVRRFAEHTALGELSEAKGDSVAAKRYYAAAARLYSDRLLASEPVEACFEERIEELERTYTNLLSRLVALHTAADEQPAVRALMRSLVGRMPAQRSDAADGGPGERRAAIVV